jgi:FkbM family methyltransferase
MPLTVSVLFHARAGVSPLAALQSLKAQQSPALQVELLVHGQVSAVQEVLALVQPGDWAGGVQAFMGADVATGERLDKAWRAASGAWLATQNPWVQWRSGALGLMVQACRQAGQMLCAGRAMLAGEAAAEPLCLNPGVRFGRPGLLIDDVLPPGSFVLERARVRHGVQAGWTHLAEWAWLLDNLPVDGFVLLDQDVCEVRRDALARAAQEQAERQAERARLYAAWPEPELMVQRQFLLSQGPALDLPQLMGAPPQAGLQVAHTPQGRYLICNPMETVQRSLLATGQFEPLAHRIGAAFAAARPGLVVDVGANLGAFSVPLARLMPEQPVLAIEPQPMVFMNLCANLLLNKARQVRPVQLAVGLGGGHIKVPRFDVFDERYTGSVSLDPEVMALRGSIDGVAEPGQWAQQFDEVPLVALDTLVGERSVSFIKIDVEGMELAVLRSATGVLERDAPVLFFEAWSLDAFKAHVAELLDFVATQGYEVIRLGSDCLAVPRDRMSVAQAHAVLAQAGVTVDTA